MPKLYLHPHMSPQGTFPPNHHIIQQDGALYTTNPSAIKNVPSPHTHNLSMVAERPKSIETWRLTSYFAPALPFGPESTHSTSSSDSAPLSAPVVPPSATRPSAGCCPTTMGTAAGRSDTRRRYV